jgi:putative transcriptional regulator
MSQIELAEKVQCTRQTIAALEKGQYSPSLILAYRIAKVFGKNIEEVFEIYDK